MESIKKHASSLIKTSLKSFKTSPSQLLMILVVILAAFMRSHQIGEKAILFGDAGRDLLVAQQAVKNGSIPLLGIPSSVPRFHQGPLTVWLQMVIYLLFGNQTLAYSLVFAFISLLAVIALYELVTTQISTRTGLLAASLLAFSPLAIAQARMPYHTNPIPLALIIFFFSLIYFWQKRPQGLLVALLGWSLMMQFELSLFALFFLIPYIIWRRQIKLKWSHISQASAAFIIGFGPQIIHDLTQPLKQNQLAGFIAWVGYRVLASFGLINQAHQLSVNKITTAFSNFVKYGSRIFSLGHEASLILLIILLILAVIIIIRKNKPIPPLIELVGVATLLLSFSYLLHGAPSEAYFPPYLVLLPILSAYSLKIIFTGKLKVVLLFILIAYAGLNIRGVFKHNFFVSQTKEFSYGPGRAEQSQILNLVNEISQGRYQFKTTDDYGRFPSYFASYEWLAEELSLPKQTKTGQIFYLEKPGSGLSGYPNLIKVIFPSRELYY